MSWMETTTGTDSAFSASGRRARRRFGIPRVEGRFDLVMLTWLIYVASSFSSRVMLFDVSLQQGLIGWSSVPRAMVVGLLFDAVTGLYLILPFAIYLWLMPRRAFQSRIGRGLVYAGFAVSVTAMAYLVAAEYFFFDEFNARFNYVAVEYLIYPTEVLTNIRDSYPVYRTLATAAWIGLILTFLLRRRIATAFADRPP
ncbi:MAG: hypothetical protein KIT73_20620, partial [Burkholderiales bacterium]|nr:hypothetical protein [Burkholderiales bacterium]